MSLGGDKRVVTSKLGRLCDWVHHIPQPAVPPHYCKARPAIILIDKVTDNSFNHRMPAIKRRCCCTFYKCKDSIDVNGDPGVMVDTRTHLRHKQADERQSMSDAVEEAQAKTMKEQDVKLAQSLQGMSFASPAAAMSTATPPPSHAQYKIDRTRIMVSHISKALDNIGHLRSEAESIGTASLPHPSDEAVQRAVHHLEALSVSASETRHTISLIRRKSKEASFVFLRDTATTNLEALTRLIDDYQASWRAILVDRRAQRQAELERGIAQYDSGRW